MIAEGRISGVVTDTHGNPVPRAFVYVLQSGWATGATVSSLDGSYAVGGLEAGAYNVIAYSDQLDGASLGKCYNNVPLDCSQGTLVVISPGQTTSNIDFAIDVLGKITGRVTDANGEPILGAEVRGYSQECCGTYAFTAADGSYALQRMEPGEYQIRADAPGHITECYQHARTLEQATKFQIGLNDIVNGIDFVLPSGPLATVAAGSSVASPGGTTSIALSLIPGSCARIIYAQIHIAFDGSLLQALSCTPADVCFIDSGNVEFRISGYSEGLAGEIGSIQFQAADGARGTQTLTVSESR